MQTAETPRGPSDKVTLTSGKQDVEPFDLEALKRQTKARAESLAKNMAPHRSGQVLLKLPPGQQFGGNQRQELFEDFNFTASRELVKNDDMTSRAGGRFFLAELPRHLSVAEAIAALEADGRALSAEPNHIVTRDQVVIDSTSSDQAARDQYEPPEDAPIDLRPTQWNLHNDG